MRREEIRGRIRRGKLDGCGGIQNFRHHQFVLLWFEGASGVHHALARGEMRQRIPQQLCLQRVKFGELFGPQTPANFRMARERAGAGARRVNQNAIEGRGKRQRLGCIERDQMNRRSASIFRRRTCARRRTAILNAIGNGDAQARELFAH